MQNGGLGRLVKTSLGAPRLSDLILPTIVNRAALKAICQQYNPLESSAVSVSLGNSHHGDKFGATTAGASTERATNAMRAQFNRCNRK
jgi:hypothetical protein